MADVYFPRFDNISIIPNPTNTSAPIRVIIAVSDFPLTPEWFFTGEIYSGEDDF